MHGITITLKEQEKIPSTLPITRYHVVVTGCVQGVGFRSFCERKANKFNLTGWVRNQSDGGVELEVQGSKNSVESFLSKIKKGPVLSHVSDLQKQERMVQSDESLFIIRY